VNGTKVHGERYFVETCKRERTTATIDRKGRQIPLLWATTVLDRETKITYWVRFYPDADSARRGHPRVIKALREGGDDYLKPFKRNNSRPT